MRLDHLPLQQVHKEFTHERVQLETYRHTYIIRKLIILANTRKDPPRQNSASYRGTGLRFGVPSCCTGTVSILGGELLETLKS